MTFTIRPLDPVADLDLVFAWVTEPRAEFWGMTDHTRDEVGEIYTWLAEAETHHAHLVHEHGLPVAIFQTYDPFHDPIGEAYAPQVGDLGGHLFVAPTTDPEPGFTARLFGHLVDHMFSDPAVKRLVGEPDTLNGKSTRWGARLGAEHQGQVDLGHKTADLFFLDRDGWAAVRAAL